MITLMLFLWKMSTIVSGIITAISIIAVLVLTIVKPELLANKHKAIYTFLGVVSFIQLISVAFVAFI